MRKDNSRKKETAKVKFGIFTAALITAVGVFAVMTYLQRQVLSEFEKKEVCVAVRDIPAGIVIDDVSAGEYLTVRSVDAGCVPEGAFLSPDMMNGMTPVYVIRSGSVMTDCMLTSPDEVLAGMKDPVLAGFKTDDLSKAVSGVLRAGDRIDIYSTDPESGEGILLCSDVYVERGYDASAEPVSGDRPAVMFNIYLESSDADRFYEGLISGSLYVVKRVG